MSEILVVRRTRQKGVCSIELMADGALPDDATAAWASDQPSRLHKIVTREFAHVWLSGKVFAVSPQEVIAFVDTSRRTSDIARRRWVIEGNWWRVALALVGTTCLVGGLILLLAFKFVGWFLLAIALMSFIRR